MTLSPKIAPSIWAADLTQLGAQLAECQAAGADVIHIDVMDGQFVPNISVGPVVVEAVRRVTTLPLDVHLMIVNPDRYLADFARAGADWLTVHVEACPHIHYTVQQIRALGKRAGVALNPGTPATALSEVLADVDLVLAMTVNPGFFGQKYIASVLPKVRQVRALIEERHLPVEIEVDGGITPANIRATAEAGASIFVASAAIFKTGQPIATSITALRSALTV